MAKLVWDAVGERMFETGVDHGVLYLKDAAGAYPAGVAWNGLTGVTESPSGAEATPLYADNIKYLNLISAEEFGYTIEAFMYPEEFAECNGEASVANGVTFGQQTRKAFGMCYRTLIGNDVDGNEHGYKLHLVYDSLAGVSEKAYATVNDSPEAITFSWECTTTPVAVTKKVGDKTLKPTACITIDSTTADKVKLAALEAILYGSESEEARLPLPDEVIELMGAAA